MTAGPLKPDQSCLVARGHVGHAGSAGMADAAMRPSAGGACGAGRPPCVLVFSGLGLRCPEH